MTPLYFHEPMFSVSSCSRGGTRRLVAAEPRKGVQRMNHEWALLARFENESGSADSLSMCSLCGTVRHEYSYAHGRGTSPGYPRFFAASGSKDRGLNTSADEPACTETATAGVA
jgi:hypothetical protein